jgi:rhodanese-related sulfurtransferase
MDMRLISAQELKEKLDRGDPLKLVNALGDWEYRAEHIPGSLHSSSPEEMLRGLGRDDEIVVHCSNPSCMASVALYQLLERNGYRNVRRFAGGLQEGRRPGIRWKGRWWMGPGPEETRRTATPATTTTPSSARWSRARTGASGTRSASSSTPTTEHPGGVPRPATTGGTCPCTWTYAA